MTIYTFYYLSSQDTNEIFYIGVTTKELKQRFKQHILEAKSGTLGKKCDFIRYCNFKIKITPIEAIGKVNNNFDYTYREKYWIMTFLRNGHPILNASLSYLALKKHEFKYTYSYWPYPENILEKDEE